MKTQKNQLRIPNAESLKKIAEVANEAAIALNDETRTIAQSSIPEVLTGVLGAGAGGAVSFLALYGLGIVGLSAAGITSALATAGAIVGGGMAAGVFVITLPILGLSMGGVALARHLNNKRLIQSKLDLLPAVTEQKKAIAKKLEEMTELSQDRRDYLRSLHILLEAAERDLMHDIALKVG